MGRDRLGREHELLADRRRGRLTRGPARGNSIMHAVETLVVGAGQAGLAVSRCLTGQGADHVVVERGRIAERCRPGRHRRLLHHGDHGILLVRDGDRAWTMLA
jgi:FAD binding domain